MMRIITGKARGTKLRTLPGDNTRPTAERTKEAIFSMLQFEIEGRVVLDAFAGSGQMGLEAVSRGAARAVLLDKSKEATEIIRKNIELTHMEKETHTVCSDVTDYLKRMSGKECYDIVFLDPPYNSDLIKSTLSCLISYNMLRKGAFVVCESGTQIEDLEIVSDRFEIIKCAKYGIAYVTILRLKEYIS